MPSARTYSAGTAFITVVPSFLGIEKAFKDQVRDMAQAADKDLAAGMARGLKEINRQAKNTGARAGSDYAGAYEAEAKKALDKAWRSLPTPQPDVNLRKWDKALLQVRTDMKELSAQRIGIDIDRETFDRAIADFRRRLEELRETASGRNKEIGFFNADTAARALSDLERFTDQAARKAGEGGELVGSAFNERMTRVLREGAGKIPPLKLTADSTDAERKMVDLRQRMLDLADKKIGVDIDAGAAYAELRTINAEMQALDRRDVRVDIRTNAHEAAAGMSALITQAEKAGQSVQGIGTRANFSLSRLEYLIALGASLGTSIVPAALAAAGAVGLIGTSAIGAVSGLGVFALGVSGVGDAVKALNQYANDQAKSANSVNQANRQMAASTDAVRMAQLALANTRRNVSEAAEDAARRVTDAERGVVQARRDAAQASRDAAREVSEARERVADAEEEVGEARRQARLDIAEADRQVADAQRAVTEAEHDAVEVRKSLNEAIADAVRNMEELDVALKRNDLDQQKAVTAQMKALEELNKLRMNPRATEVELRQAQDAYDEQTQRILELKQKHKELADDKAKYDRDGVEGDEQVIAVRKRIADADQRVADARARLAREQAQRQEVQYRAEKRIADAQERVAKAQEAVARAQEAQRETEIRNQDRIAAAQRQVADARRQQARQALDGQYQLAQASRAVEQAQRQQQQAWEKTGTAGGEALQNLNEKMGQLSPAAQHFAEFLFGLKDEFLELRAAAAEPLLPRLEEAINLLVPYLPAVKRFVGDVAAAMGDLAVRAAQALGNPVWQRFFHFVDQSAVPALNTLYDMGMNVAEGLVSLFLALTPFNGQVGTGLVNLTRDFAEWAERLNKTQGYQDFLDYVQANGPRVVHFLGEIGELFIDLVKAAAPLGSIVLRSLTLLVDAINSLPDGALTGLVIAIGAVSAGLTAIGGIMRVIKLREQLTEIFGPRSAAMVQQYAINTGRATEETSRFGKATATVSGLAAAARDRIQGYGTAVGAVPGKLQALTTGSSALGRSLDSVRVAALTAATATNGPGGLAGAVQAAGGRMANLATTGQTAAAGGLNRFRVAMLEISAAANGPGGVAAASQVAAGKVGGLAKSAGNAATTIGGKLVTGLGLATSALGGPWIAALTGASIAIGVLAKSSADYNGKIETLASTLGSLGTQYQELSQAGKVGTPDATKMLTEIAMQNPEMRQAVTNLDSIGVSMTQLGRAAAGSQEDLRTVLAALDEEIDRTEKKWKDQSNFLFTVWSSDARQTSDRLEQLRQLREAVAKNADQNKVAAEVQKAVTKEDERAAAITAFRSGQVLASTDAVKRQIDAYDSNAESIRVLNGVVTAFGNVESTATERANAMREAIEHQTSAAINETEAEENLASKMLALRDQVNQNKAAHDKHATSLSLNSTTALRNRDALEEVAKSIRDMYIQDIAAGKPLADVTKAHNKRIDALKEEAAKLGLSKTQTEKLIKTYGDVPDDVTTKVGIDKTSFDAVYRNLQKVQFMQQMLRIGMPSAKAEEEWLDYQREMNRALKRAEGGPIDGPGTSTSDSIPAWLSKGEWVHRASAVDYYGDQTMAALNAKRIPREVLHGYATGGRAGQLPEDAQRLATGGRVKQTWPMPVDVSKTWVPTSAWVRANTAIADLGSTFTGLSPDASVAKIQKFALAQRGKRYLWAAVGPRAYDCSGLVGNLWALATGHKLYRRYMSTADMGPGRHGMVSGPGKHMTIYLGPGHTAANVGGLHVEAHGGNGTPLAIGRIGTRLSYYNRKLHIPGFAEGGMVDAEQLKTKRDRMVSFLRYGWPEPPSGTGFADLLSSPLVSAQYDSGGMLPPGISTVLNNTGQPEPVLTQQQWRDIRELAADASRGRGNTYQFEFRDTTLDPGRLHAIQEREAVLARDGRAR